MITTLRLSGSATPSAVRTAGARFPREIACMSSAGTPSRISAVRTTSARCRPSASLNCIRADRIGMADDQHVRHRAFGDFRQQTIDLATRLLGEFVTALDEVERERFGACRLRSQCRAELCRHVLRAGHIRARTAGSRLRGGVRMIQHDFLVALLDGYRRRPAILLGQQHDGGARAGAQHRAQRGACADATDVVQSVTHSR